MGSSVVASHSWWDDRFDRDELGLDPEDDEFCEDEEEDEEEEEDDECLS